MSANMASMAPLIARLRELRDAEVERHREIYDRLAAMHGYPWPTTAEIEARRAARWPSWSHG